MVPGVHNTLEVAVHPQSATHAREPVFELHRRCCPDDQLVTLSWDKGDKERPGIMNINVKGAQGMEAPLH